MNKNKMEREVKIFTGKGNIKNTLITVESVNQEEESQSNNNNNKPENQNQNPFEYNIKVNKKRIKKETSLKQVRTPGNIFYFKNNFSPKKNTPSINGNVSKKNINRPSIAEKTSLFEKDSIIDSSNSNRYSYLPKNEPNNSEYNSQDINSQTKSSNISNTVSEIEEDEKEDLENENESSKQSTNNSEWSKKFKDKLFDIVCRKALP